MSNICTRCGRERIIDKTWEETIQMYGRTSVVVNTSYVCTDPECQRMVEKHLSEQKENKMLLEQQKEREKQIRLKNAIKTKLRDKSSTGVR